MKSGTAFYGMQKPLPSRIPPRIPTRVLIGPFYVIYLHYHHREIPLLHALHSLLPQFASRSARISLKFLPSDYIYREIERNGLHGFSVRSFERIRKGQRSSRQKMPQARSQRIYEGGNADGDRLRGDGIRWLFRQIDFHSHQQHHCRRFLNR